MCWIAHAFIGVAVPISVNLWSPNPLTLEQPLHLALHCWTCLKPETVELMVRTAGLGGVTTNAGPPLNALNRERNLPVAVQVLQKWCPVEYN